MDGQALGPRLTFTGHINELRRRLTWPALALIVSGSLGYVFHTAIIDFLKRPLHQTLYFTTPAGNFNFIMKICGILGLTLAIPLLLYSLVAFIEPALPKKLPRRSKLTVTFLSLFLGIGGAAFAYYLVIPMALHFFMGFKINGISPLITADDYLNFILTCILSFILMFQLPLLILFINNITPLPPRKLLKYERHVIVGALVIALVLPFTYDPITQFAIALPIILLYNLSVLLVWLANRRRPKTGQLVKAVRSPVATQPTKPTPKPLLEPAPATPHLTQPDFAKPSFDPSFIKSVASRQPIASQRLIKRRPVLDVVGDQPHRNFLDLRPSARTGLNRVQ